MLESLLRARGSRWLSATYRLLPERLRARCNELLWRTVPEVGFPVLPEVDAAGAWSQVKPDFKEPGFNIYGYFSANLGLGEGARLYAGALMSASVAVSIHDLDIDIPHRRLAFRPPENQDIPAKFEFDLIVVNPDMFNRALPAIERESNGRNYRFAAWFWELEEVPSHWKQALEHVDEIVVASEFVEKAFRQITDKPVLRVPLPVTGGADSGLTRRDFRLPKRAFIFLTSFDFYSYIHRKYPLGTIAAFRNAFPTGREDVRLVVKSSHGDKHLEAMNVLLAAARLDPRILVRDEVIEAPHMRALQRCADAYVSLHRAEGFGLGMAECMALGKPVIATAWSGNMEFMTSETACLVDYRLIPVAHDQYPDSAGARWAEPDIAHAAMHMRRLVDEPDFAHETGMRASVHVRDHLSSKRAAAIFTSRLAELAPGRQGRKC